MPRIVLLVTSPRLPAGLLTAHTWDLVRSCPVLAAAEHPQVAALRAAGVPVRIVATGQIEAMLAAAVDGDVVWLASPDGDQTMARTLGLRLAREPGLAELELCYGSWDPPGARLLDAVAVIDRLMAPDGGDPWKRAQTHRSLARYLIEECYEAYDAIVADDAEALREELGDLLLQVVLHARLAQELPEDERWSVDEVAGDLVAKMIRRNPHVFAGAKVADMAEIVDNWESIKQAEKSRASAMDGIALAQPALALAAKILERAARSVAPPSLPVPPPDPFAGEDALGAALLDLVAAAGRAGLDPEAALRRAALAHAAAVRAAETR
ncbi:nucleoside triphosphate pyrophosphohydrolase [Pilimelia columellifera subsp. columellifera]|uniref:Nucleoside triphosphate pyrophosphohydrolase n=1 Tax=Pilimelia columellifera subsp. columellifera TaxID=706583 RepID=A0ABN3NKD0_9ACTN